MVNYKVIKHRAGCSVNLSVFLPYFNRVYKNLNRQLSRICFPWLLLSFYTRLHESTMSRSECDQPLYKYLVDSCIHCVAKTGQSGKNYHFFNAAYRPQTEIKCYLLPPNQHNSRCPKEYLSYRYKRCLLPNFESRWIMEMTCVEILPLGVVGFTRGTHIK
jgi:hypothetical protein